MGGPLAKLGMIADDLTGACDAGVQFARRGFPAMVSLSEAEANAPGLVVLTTDSRNDLPEIARSKVESACRRLAASGAEIVYKKIDSTLYGNVGPEIEAAMQVCGCREAWLAPAFPAMGRTVVDGWLHVAGSDRRVDVRALVRGCSGIRVLDAAAQQDLCAIARAAAETNAGPLLAGSAGLAIEVAVLLAAKRGIAPPISAVARAAAVAAGPLVFFIGSNHPATLAQVQYLLANRRATTEPRAAREALSRGDHLVIRVPRGAAARACEAAPLLRQHTVRGVVLSGGDTATLVCGALGVAGIRLSCEIITGVPCGTLVGGPLDGLPVATKAGGFGGEDALAVIADFLAARAHVS